MDVFNCLYIIDYICYSSPNTILYRILILFVVVERKLPTQAGLEKSQRGSTSTIRNKVRPMIPQCQMFGFFCILGKIDFQCQVVYCGTPKPQKVSLCNRIGDSTGEAPCFSLGMGVQCVLYLPFVSPCFYVAFYSMFIH